MAVCSTNPTPKAEDDSVLIRWADRWSKNNLGWHIEQPNPALVQYLPLVLDKQENKKSILVPLCGKTVDMAYLADHPSIQHVVGVEGIQIAIDDFAKENSSLNIQKSVGDSTSEKFAVFQGSNISLLKGDFFDLDSSSLPTQLNGEGFDIVWDRASMVAIDPSLRQEYVKTIEGIMNPGGVILLSTFDRRSGNPDAMAAGPPFSINEATVRELFESQPWVENIVTLGEKDEMDTEKGKKRWGESGLTEVFEMYFIIYTKAATDV